MREIEVLKQWHQLLLLLYFWGGLKHLLQESWGVILSHFLLSSFKWQQEICRFRLCFYCSLCPVYLEVFVEIRTAVNIDEMQASLTENVLC